MLEDWWARQDAPAALSVLSRSTAGFHRRSHDGIVAAVLLLAEAG